MEFFDLLPLLAQDDGGSWLDNLNPLNWIKYLADGAYKGVKRFFCWMVLEGLEWAEDFAAIFASYIPSVPPFVGNLMSWFGMINAWVPVDTFLWCGVTYLIVCASIASIRFVKSWIPTLGG